MADPGRSLSILASQLHVKEAAMLPEGTANPNHPCNINPERERREEELYTDAMLAMETARRIEDLQEFLNSLNPSSNEFRDLNEDQKAALSDLHDHTEETVREESPEAYRDWLARQRPRERLAEQIRRAAE